MASDEDVGGGVARTATASRAVLASGRAAGRILAARLIANIPLLLVLAWGSVRLVVDDLQTS